MEHVKHFNLEKWLLSCNLAFLMISLVSEQVFIITDIDGMDVPVPPHMFSPITIDVNID